MDSASACKRTRGGRSSSAAAPKVGSVSPSPSPRSRRQPTPASFPKRVRLRKRREYVSVQQKGRKVPGELFLVLVKRTPSPRTRVGVTVSSKVGGAVVRNRLKRWVREHVRRRLESLPKGLDVVIVARNPAGLAGHADVDQDLGTVLSRLSHMS